MTDYVGRHRALVAGQTPVRHPSLTIYVDYQPTGFHNPGCHSHEFRSILEELFA